MPSIEDVYVLFNASVFIGTLLMSDSRHAEAQFYSRRPAAGTMLTCKSTGILSEVYVALTWQQAQPPDDPAQPAEAVSR